MQKHSGKAALALALAGLMSTSAVYAVSLDHQEFEATLVAPFTGQGSEARQFELNFSYIDAVDRSSVAWRLELLTNDGKEPVHTWRGEQMLFRKQVVVTVPWDGLNEFKRSLPDGFYKVRMTAAAADPFTARSRFGSMEERVDATLSLASEPVVQEWDIHVGTPARVAMPAFNALPVGAASGDAAPAIGSLPYTVYLGNFHTQSNDSDGGGAIPGCTSSQSAQSGTFGPSEGFSYARGRGLDFSAATEHNHYFDGSSSTNASASASVAKSRYQAGVNASNTFNAANPGFVALYGMEWGVISGGGHLNILNATELFAWEYNSSSQLLGDTFVAKNDYATLYSTMRAKGFVGQFNHPASSGQFLIGSTALGYTADGDEVMALAEIQNTSAFSSNTTETETGRSTYEPAFKALLERGYHVAPATNQDNHCANWGASWTNRTGVLIPNGTPLSKAALIDAVRARRVFATSDKNSQIILTANGRIMGERFSNTGVLNLVVNYANTAGRSVSQVAILEGVPGRNGTVTTLASSATFATTPSLGQHFYYARITQDDGKILWSAPIWLNQSNAAPSNVAPVANFGSTTSGLTATFSNSSTDSDGSIAAHLWNFGDSTTSTAVNPVKTYSTAGTYTVSLRVTDNGGLSNTRSGSVTVSSAAVSFFQNSTDYPIADFATVDSPITVAGRSGNAPSTLSVSVNIVHTYQGDLKVDLVAPDGTLYNVHNRTGAGTDNIVKTITVNASSELANGLWKLRVNDNATGDTGYINSWSLQF